MDCDRNFATSPGHYVPADALPRARVADGSALEHNELP